MGDENQLGKRHMAISDLDAIETLSDITNLSTISGTDIIYKTAQFIYGNELSSGNIGKEPSKRKRIQQQSAVRGSVDKNGTKTLQKFDNVYEEIDITKESPTMLEYNILDYYEKYSPTTAKTLINTLFLPRHKICKQCANLKNSPVYTDRLIYSKELLHAREVLLYQQNESLCFKYCLQWKPNMMFSQYDQIQHCMPVYNFLKTTASSIFYLHGPPQDIFDLKSILKPSILIKNGYFSGTINTHLYHRCINNFYTRISQTGCKPMTFCVDHDNVLKSLKNIGYDTDLQNWMNYRSDVLQSRSLKPDDGVEYHPNRSSLLLLEPLLLMPELTSSRQRHVKNRIAHSEHMKVIKIVIAYTLSFIILAVITFYIVYFT